MQIRKRKQNPDIPKSGTNTWSADGLKERQQHPLTPLSMLACPAEGHFATSDKKVEYLALYIKKAVQYRMSSPLAPHPSSRIPINPTKTGWLADKWRLDQPPRTRYPVKVTVVAWQYGRSGEPKLKTAEPVERTFSILR